MKKEELKKVVNSKGKVKPKTGSHKSKTSKTVKKKNTPKKKTVKKTTPVKEKKVLIPEELLEEKEKVKKKVEEPKKEIVKEEKKEEVTEEEEEIVLPFKLRMKRFFIRLGIFILSLIILLLVFLTITEYRPKSRESVPVMGEVHRTFASGEVFTVMTWNIGYGALGDNADFFMDGGKMVQTADRFRVNRNLLSIRNKIDEVSPTFLFLQEVDQSSKRDNHVDEYSVFLHHLTNYQSSYAYNYKALYVPYPIPMIGNVKSGIASYSKYRMDSSERIQLPVPFIWPVKTVNLKRCLLISRIPIEGSEQELVLVNLHLEAYDNGKGKEKQTKMLLDVLNEEAKKGNYVIAGGDFNQAFSSVDASLKEYAKGLWAPGELEEKDFGEEWKFFMDTTNPTCRSLDQPYKGADPETFQYYYIDGFIVSSNINVEAVETLNLGFTSSDHNPVVLRANIPQNQG